MTTTCAGCGTTSDTDTLPEGWIEHYGVYGCDACRVGFRGERPSVLGLDISSVRLDACLLVPGEPPLLRHEIIGKSSEPLIERIRRVPAAVHKFTFLGEGSRDASGKYGRGMMATEFYPIVPDWLAIEDSYGAFRNAVRALDKITGAIIASCPSETQVALVSTGDWRKALGCAKNTKDEGHLVVTDVLRRKYRLSWEEYNYNEHELDAIGIALGWARILASQATP